MNIRLPFLATLGVAILAGSFAIFRVNAAGPVAPVTGVIKETRWDDLVPKEWDPLKRFRNAADPSMMNDSNPRVLEMMREMREAWDNAPTNAKMDGVAVKLPGYVVPLEEVKGELTEFLLVPYFGACIHTPPPPANQIVHVVASKPLKGLRMMDAIWASGTLRTQRENSVMGMSGYHLEGAVLERYTPPARP